MKKRFIIILFVLCFFASNCAEGATVPTSKVNTKYPELKTTLPPISAAPAASAPTIPQPVDFSACNKYFKMDGQKLFYLTLASVNANRFKIDEIQSKSGYVVFTAAQKQFLASVIAIDSQNSLLKITPCSNVYFFQVGIVQNMFKYVELNVGTPVEKLVVL